ncbi:hypothetical protein [Peribacillus simplex]|uniref:hypothetical protein n=1 Tax=Peribacillus simplex TaxID=1478 RepID=UPI0009712DB0|nr:hypothetical protein [Peribacillus simplex]
MTSKGKGIGAAIVDAILAKGVRVAVSDIDSASLEPFFYKVKVQKTYHSRTWWVRRKVEQEYGKYLNYLNRIIQF